jgi:hypothetical protein
MMANPKTYLYTPPPAVAQNNPVPVAGQEKVAQPQAATHTQP